MRLSVFRRALTGASTAEVAAVTSDRGSVSPDLERVNRVVVCGTQIGGVFRLAAEFDEFLRANGIESPDVAPVRDVNRIEDAFFGRGQDNVADTLPRGVIALPQMRHYGELSGNGMTVDTPYDAIGNLCARYEVPMVRVDEVSRHAIGAGIVQLVLPPAQ